MPNATIRQDVRLTIQTNDNVLIYVEYGGVGKLSTEAGDGHGKGKIFSSHVGNFIITPSFQITALC